MDYVCHKKCTESDLLFQKTETFGKPRCMGRSFFWWSYEGKYESRRESSFCNMHEIEMVVSLCCWLVCNGVGAASIAVLTPYRGQVHVYYDVILNSVSL